MIQGNFLKIPQTGDRGNSFCPALSTNMEVLDTHSHNGVNSEKIASSSITKPEIILASNAWVLDGADYKQTVTLPNGYDFDKTHIKFVISSGDDQGSVIHPTVVKISSSTFSVYVMKAIELKVLVI